MSTYSFLNIQAAITGPGGSVNLGNGAGPSEEGITVEMIEDKDTLTLGADGTPMHALHAGQGGRMVVRLLKTSPTNAQLAVMYSAQFGSSGTWGVNTITINDPVRGDNITGSQMAFVKFPNITYSKEGAMNEWSFSGIVNQVLGSGDLLAA